MDHPPETKQRGRIRRSIAMAAAVALVSPLGFYIASLRGDEEGDPTASVPSSPTETEPPPDPFDVPADLLSCLPTEDLEPVTGSTLDEQIDGVERAVERLRSLRSKERVPITLLSPEDVAARLERDQLGGLSRREIDRDTRILEMLGVVPEGTDLEDLGRQLSGQIVGYYDPEARELFVNARSKDQPLPPAGEITLAHELEHAIADEAFKLPIRTDAPPSKADAQLAKRSLVEGDATLLTRHYAIAVLSPEQITELQSDPATKKALRDADKIPPAIQILFQFPYTHGLGFACELFGEGGWKAVDRAYDRPPSTTAQVMFPERYRAREEGVPADPLGKLPEPWRRLGGSAVGASDLFALFSAPGGDTGRALDDPTAAAAGWAGGAVEVWSNGKGSALGMALVEREPEDGLCDSVHAWYRVGFPEARAIAGEGDAAMAVKGPDGAALLHCRGEAVRLGIGPTLAVARALID